MNPINATNILTGNRGAIQPSQLVSVTERTRDFILSIPHAGLLVPDDLLDAYDANEDWRIEVDMLSDLPYEMDEGILVRTELPPFVVDMNRTEEREEDIPHHLTNDPYTYHTIKDRPLLVRNLHAGEREFLQEAYNRYHVELSEAIETMRAERGYALVIDAHSMTSIGLGRAHDTGRRRPDFAVGTLAHSSAHEDIIKTFTGELQARCEPFGLRVGIDTPYAGGFITRLHHDPENGVHVIQLEISMGMYLIEGFDERVERRYEIKQELEDIRRIVTASIRETARYAAEHRDTLMKPEPH